VPVIGAGIAIAQANNALTHIVFMSRLPAADGGKVRRSTFQF